MDIQVLSESESETFDFGSRLGAALPATVPGFMIGLTGTLGAGKTAFIRGMAEGIEVDSTNVVSPTFSLVVPYQGRIPMLHMDAYRIEAIEELDELGLDEQLEAGWSLVCEWVERIEEGLPDLDLRIAIEPTAETGRSLRITAISKRAIEVLQGLRLNL